MEDKPGHKPANLLLRCVLLVAFCNLCRTQKICTVLPGPVFVPENNTVDIVVAKINADSDVRLTIVKNPEDLFFLKEVEVLVKKGLDYESPSGAEAMVVQVQCSRSGSRSVNVSVKVFVQNVNDNPPNFLQDHYVLEVNELSPLNSSVGVVDASDIDSEVLYYRLEPTTDKYFRLENINTPRILVQNILDYDVIQKINLVLHVQDILNGSTSNKPFFTSVATITVHVKDIDNRPPWYQPCVRANLGMAKLCVSTGYKGRVNLTEKEEGNLILEPGPLYAKDGDKNRSESISYKILRGNEGNIFQINEETGNISMVKAADIVGPITLVVLASQVTNRDQFAMTQVTIEVMKKSRNPPRFDRERYDGFIYSNSIPESMILRDRTSNRPYRVRAGDEDFATGVNPDVRYEVQYSSYVNVTAEGFVILKRVVKTESFALQLKAVDTTTGEYGTAALTVQVIPAVAVPSQTGGGYRAGDMALLGLIMAAVLILCLIVIGFLISHLWKGNSNVNKLSECLSPCLRSKQHKSGHRDSMQYTNDGFQNEGDPSRGGGGGGRRCAATKRSTVPQARGRVIPMERRGHHCSSCGLYTNHVPKGSPLARASGRIWEDLETKLKRRKREGQKTVWFKESEDSSDIEVEIIPDTVGRVAEETAEEMDAEMEGGAGETVAATEGSGEGDAKTEPSEDVGAGGSDSAKEGEEVNGGGHEDTGGQA
ncbi:cadherin-related family member 5 [Gadus morhua]|uniref:Cadherin domain-containing protein n=1 Tax=Gadus morhua TaxID=8049 RepID=A0A8C5CQ12_GADMO|nr:cadherin-related family member 5-like [Gadus morhua]